MNPFILKAPFSFFCVNSLAVFSLSYFENAYNCIWNFSAFNGKKIHMRFRSKVNSSFFMSSDSTFFIETSAQSAVNQLKASNEKTKLQKRRTILNQRNKTKIL
ncbi:hypothetical protein RA13_03305 [Bacillus atrophaeus]|nr:hypothetical protein RA13_03305 [Bacillus atrophaeus]PSA90327.1 hypothetical protein C6371_12250 [Bacillus atrophaeus]